MSTKVAALFDTGPRNILLTPRQVRGPGSDSWYWHLVAPELEALGHDVVVPDLPCNDDRAGLAEYAEIIIDAIGDRSRVILVAQSLAGFTATLVAARIPVDLLIVVAAMVPRPGEAPGGGGRTVDTSFPSRSTQSRSSATTFRRD